MAKSPDAFRTISEVADWLGVEAHVLRFWETKFTHVKPVKRAGGRRYYRPTDMALLGGIRRLLHDEGMTIRGVQKILREKGVGHVAGMAADARPVIAEPAAAARFERAGRRPESQVALVGQAVADDDAPTLPFDLPHAPFAAASPEPAGPTRPIAAADPPRVPGSDGMPLAPTKGDATDGAGLLPRQLRTARLDPAHAAEVLARARALVERLRSTPE